MNTSSKFFLALFIFLITLIIYAKSQVLSNADTIWSLYVTASILKEGNTNLDEYTSLIAADDYRIERIGNHTYTVFPIGSSVLAVPFVFVAQKIFPFIEQMTFSDYLSQHQPDQIIFQVEKIIASIITALNVVIIFLIAIKLTTPVHALIVSFIFAFATSAWSTASRGLWQHGPSMLVLSIALYVVVLSKEKPWLLQFISLPLALAYIIRPTNIISVLVLSFYIFLVARQYIIKYLIWLLLLVLPFLLHNYTVYGMVVSPYYLPQRLGNSPFFLEAVAGNFISPSRGLLIFSPILAFSIYGISVRLKKANWQTLDRCLVAILMLHWISISLFRQWYGGWSIGPRFFTDMIPIFVYFLIPATDRFSNLTPKLDLGFYLFWLLTIASILIHFRCATEWAPTEWNYLPNNIDQDEYRLWDWSDIQFLRRLCPEPFYQAPKCWFSQESGYLKKKLTFSENVIWVNSGISHHAEMGPSKTVLREKTSPLTFS